MHRTDRRVRAVESLHEAARLVKTNRTAEAALHCLVALSHIVSTDPRVGEAVQVLARKTLHGDKDGKEAGGG